MTLQETEWNPRFLLLSNGLLAIAILSFFLPPFREIWRETETNLFWFFNNSLAENPTWAKFWALANHRSERRFTPFILAGINASYVFFHRKKSLSYTAAQFVFFWLCMQIVIPLMNIFVMKGLEIRRLSPTMFFTDSFWLSKAFDDPMIRDHSKLSFHSGHAFNKTFWAAFTISLCHKRPYKILALFVVVSMSLPRLVGGGHWLSDVVFAILMALAVVSWLLATPIRRLGPEAVHKFFQKFGSKRSPNPEAELPSAG